MAETVFNGRAAAQPPAVARRNNKRFQLLAVALLIAIAIGYLVYSGLRTNVYYQTVSELQGNHANVGRQVRVAGNVVDGSIAREEGSSTVRFSIQDASGVLPVVYSGAVPDIFAPGIEVVVEGKYSPTSGFAAETMLAKCPSKFEEQ